MAKQKVFCVGFQKTGTTSLGLALDGLGYTTAGYHQFRDMADADRLTMDQLRDRAFEVANEHDAFKDTPWPILYKELDRAYPGSKFILIIRDTEKWIASATGDFGEIENSIHQLIYNSPYPIGNEDSWVQRYEHHNRDVQQYFANRPDDLLVMRMDKGELNWVTLCEFLGVAAPDKPWPRANTKSAKKWKMMYWRMKERLGLS